MGGCVCRKRKCWKKEEKKKDLICHLNVYICIYFLNKKKNERMRFHRYQKKLPIMNVLGKNDGYFY
jgi:hypothetical protein